MTAKKKSGPAVLETIDLAEGPPLHVASVQVKSFLGIQEGAITPGKITLFAGRNGTNKTSWLRAIQTGLGGGNLAKLARVGAEDDPEIVIVLEGEGSEAHRVEKSGDETASVKSRVGDSAAFEDRGQPQAWLSSLYDPRGSNPVALFRAKDREFALMLLEALDLDMDRTGLEAIQAPLDRILKERPKVMAGLHPLEELAQIRAAIFGARTGVNRDEKNARASADQLRRALPAVMPETHEDAIADREAKVAASAAVIERSEGLILAHEKAALDEAKANHALKSHEIEAQHKEAVRKLQADHAAEAAEIRRRAEAEIARLAGAMNAAIEGLREATSTRLDEQDGALRAVQESVRDSRAAEERGLSEVRNRLAVAREELATLRAQRDEALRAQGLQVQAQEFERQAKALAADADTLTEGLDRLDAFRQQLAKNLPIPGLEIDGQEIRLGGIPLDQINKAKRMKLCVQVCVLRAQGRLPIVWVDDAEALDTDEFGALVEELKQHPVQVFISRVEDHDLKVEALA